MVFRTRPRMTAEEAGLRRRTKCFIFLVLLVVASITYYSWNYRSEHVILEDNYKRVIAQGKKYAAAYIKCDRNLRTAKSNFGGIQKSNTEMQTKIASQEKEIAELDAASNDAHMKLQNAYQFYLDAKDLIGNDQSVSENLAVSPDAAEALKKEITNLKADKEGYERLKTAHAATLQALEDIKVDMKKTSEEHTTRTSDLENRQRKTAKQNKVLKQMKQDLIKELDKRNILINDLSRKAKMKETKPVMKNEGAEMSTSSKDAIKQRKQTPTITKSPITTASSKKVPPDAPKQAPPDAPKKRPTEKTPTNPPKKAPTNPPKKAPTDPREQEKEAEIETEKRIEQEDDQRVINIHHKNNEIPNNPTMAIPAHLAKEHNHENNLKEQTNKEESEGDFAEGEDDDDHFS